MSMYMQINVDIYNFITYSTPTSVNTHSAQTSFESTLIIKFYIPTYNSTQFHWTIININA